MKSGKRQGCGLKQRTRRSSEGRRRVPGTTGGSGAKGNRTPEIFGMRAALEVQYERDVQGSRRRNATVGQGTKSPKTKEARRYASPGCVGYRSQGFCNALFPFPRMPRQCRLRLRGVCPLQAAGITGRISDDPPSVRRDPEVCTSGESTLTA
jgi:hypothetical protein